VLPTETEAHEILNLEEASRYLRIKRRTMYTLAERRVVPGVKIGGQWRFCRSQLERLFETPDQPIPPTPTRRVPS
jgi:excisionase family DNA binding protein